MEYVVCVIISSLLILILFFSLRSTVKRIDINTKKYFIEKLQDYDYLIEEKKKILNELNKEIEKNKEYINKKTKSETNVSFVEKNDYYGELNVPKYMDENLFKTYKNIKEKFSFNKNDIILDFIKNIDQDDNEDYLILSNVRKKFDNNTVYNILKLQKNEQKEYLKNILSASEFEVIKKYIKFENLKINNFITKLDIIIEKIDPKIYIYTGEKNENFDNISNKVKTEYDESINEGIKIKFKGNLYDYSL